MRMFTRWLMAGVLALTPVAGLVEVAVANTELVPAARLVGPYWDVQTGKDTFLLLTNVGNDDLKGTATGSVGAVHLQFYDKTCSRHDRVIELSSGDVDQLQLSKNPNLTSVSTLPSKFGFVDIDVRSGSGTETDNSTEENDLLGTMIVVNATDDYALAYPLAASVGSSSAGEGNTIVNRATGVWSGGYEPYPARLFVPMFLADDATATSGQVISTSLYIAGVASGNWLGGTTATNGAPGDSIGTETLCSADPANCAVKLTTVNIWDGCEKNTSVPINRHYVQGTLTSLFGSAVVDRQFWTTAKCGVTFAGLDEFSSGPVGWIDMKNGASDSEGTRGMVGLLTGTVTGLGLKVGDATRLWGDPEFGGRNGIYTQVDAVTYELIP